MNSYSFGTNQRSSRENNFGMNLRKIDWTDYKQHRLVNSCFHRVSSEVEDQDNDLVRQYRDALSISVNIKNAPKPILRFSQAAFPQFISEALDKMGFSKPTPIQSQGWPVAFTGRNLIGVAATGSGKTLAFLLPAILLVMKLKEDNAVKTWPSVVVLSPTRELAHQIYLEFYRFTKDIDISATCVYGGANRNSQRMALSRPNDIIIGTPGRVIDFLQNGNLDFKGVSMFIIDEADRMLDMGFEKQIRRINSQIPPKRQTLFFTATWPKEVESLSEDFLQNPIKLNIGSMDTSAVHSVIQNVQVIDRRDKFNFLMENIVAPELERNGKVLIFTTTKKCSEYLFTQVKEKTENAQLIHGGKLQQEREHVLSNFIKGRCPVLVATDVAQRGLDIPNITCVVNYDFPNQIEDYVHRIGRTGRAGKEGTSWTLFTRDDEAMAGPLIKILTEASQNIPEDLKELAENGFDMPIERVFPKPWAERTEEEKEDYNTPIQMNLNDESDGGQHDDRRHNGDEYGGNYGGNYDQEQDSYKGSYGHKRPERRNDDYDTQYDSNLIEKKLREERYDRSDNRREDRYDRSDNRRERRYDRPEKSRRDYGKYESDDDDWKPKRRYSSDSDSDSDISELERQLEDCKNKIRKKRSY